MDINPIRIDRWVQCRLVFITGIITWSINYDFRSDPVVTSNTDLQALANTIRLAINTLMVHLSTSTGFLRVECISNYPSPAVNYQGTSANATPLGGSVTGEYMPGNVAVNGTIKGTRRGRRTIGKTKLSFIPESSIANGQILSAPLTNMFAFLANRLIGYTVSGVGFLPVVASRRDLALYPCNSLAVDNLTDSTRSRMARP